MVALDVRQKRGCAYSLACFSSSAGIPSLLFRGVHPSSSFLSQVLSLLQKLKSGSGSGGRDGDGDGDLVVSAEEFVRFVGGEYEATEAAQGRLRRVLQLAGEKEGVTLEDAFGALDKVQ